MRALTEGVWLDTDPVTIVGARLTGNMTVLRLSSGGLLVCSPLRLTPARQAAVEALGPVEHLYAPNLFHHLHLGAWARAFPSARVHGPAGLTDKRPDLRVDRVHGEGPEPAFGSDVSEHVIAGCRLRETALVHRPSRTLVLTDLVANVGRPEGLWTRTYTKLAGFYDDVALSRVLRWTAFHDREAARASLDRLLAEPFERLVVGHGEPIASGARAALERAYQWLPAATERTALEA